MFTCGFLVDAFRDWVNDDVATVDPIGDWLNDDVATVDSIGETEVAAFSHKIPAKFIFQKMVKYHLCYLCHMRTVTIKIRAQLFKANDIVS